MASTLDSAFALACDHLFAKDGVEVVYRGALDPHPGRQIVALDLGDGFSLEGGEVTVLIPERRFEVRTSDVLKPEAGKDRLILGTLEQVEGGEFTEYLVTGVANGDGHTWEITVQEERVYTHGGSY